MNVVGAAALRHTRSRESHFSLDAIRGATADSSKSQRSESYSIFSVAAGALCSRRLLWQPADSKALAPFIVLCVIIVLISEKKIGMTPPVLCFSAKHTLLIKFFVLFGMCSCIQSNVSTRTAPLWHSVVQLLPFHLVDGINHWLQYFIVHVEWCAWNAQTHLSETCSYSLEKVNNANITGKRIPSWNKTTVKRVT